MVDRDALDRRLARLEELLRHLRRLAAGSRDAFLADAALHAQAERWAHLAIECCLDMAHHVIASRGLRTPATNREAFQVLAEARVLAPELARQLAGWAGLRNILVHLYLDVDHGILFDILASDLGQLDQFAAAVAAEARR